MELASRVLLMGARDAFARDNFNAPYGGARDDRFDLALAQPPETSASTTASSLNNYFASASAIKRQFGARSARWRAL